jgi:hypothetical protein
LPRIQPPKVPPEILQQLKTLKFEAYFDEPVHSDKRFEENRIRKCVIHYHLEDGTMIIIEPKIKNSGIPQGTLVKRHRFKKNDDEFYGFEDLRLGAVLPIYGRDYVLYNADQDTRVRSRL